MPMIGLSKFAVVTVAVMVLSGCKTMTIMECQEECAAKGMILKGMVSNPGTATRWAEDKCTCEMPKEKGNQASAPEHWYSPYGKLCPIYKYDDYNKCIDQHQQCRSREKEYSVYPACPQPSSQPAK
jgi:hypothetical protein